MGPSNDLGAKFLESLAKELFDLDDAWRSVHSRIWSLRTLFNVARSFRRVNYPREIRLLAELEMKLSALDPQKTKDSSATASQVLDFYREALGMSIRLLQLVCVAMHQRIEEGDLAAVRERDRWADVYLRSRDLTKSLRRQVEKLLK